MTSYIYLKTFHQDLDSIYNEKGEIKNLIKKYKSNQEKQDINNDIFSNFKILNTKTWNQNFMDWEELKFDGKEAESIIINKNYIKEEPKETKKEEKSQFNTILSVYYVPQITLN